MVQTHRPIMTHRKLLLFKWLMVLIPPITVTVGHTLLLAHREGRLAEAPSHTAEETLLVTLAITFLALVLAYMFVETLFGVLRRLQAESAFEKEERRTA
jgi:hypothetical protein